MGMQKRLAFAGVACVLAILLSAGCAAPAPKAKDCGTGPCPVEGAPFPSSPEGAFCGGLAGIACQAGYECKFDGNYPDAGGKCVKTAAEGTPPIAHTGTPVKGTENCSLLQNPATGETDCFGCVNGNCKNAGPGWEPLQRAPGKNGIPYACYVDAEGRCALAQ